MMGKERKVMLGSLEKEAIGDKYMRINASDFLWDVMMMSEEKVKGKRDRSV